jgi:hypothetical protein
MTPLETLKAARDLISDPARWTQGCAARNANGESVDLMDEPAVCWCALGAIARTELVRGSGISDASKALRRVTPFGLVAHFNDTHDHAEVIALFDAAIAELEGEG